MFIRTIQNKTRNLNLLHISKLFCNVWDLALVKNSLRYHPAGSIGEKTICPLLEKRPRLQVSNFGCIILASLAFGANDAYAQKNIQSPPSSGAGFSIHEAKEIAQPVADFLASVFLGVHSLWDYFISNTALAILVSAIVAYIVSTRNIKSSRATARLRESYNAVDSSIKDRKMKKIREVFKLEQIRMKGKPNDLAKYNGATDGKDVEIASALNTILQEYENWALGVRHDIIDEDYMYRWCRTLAIGDWRTLSPLVTAKRSDGSPTAYIEFEGLAKAWEQGRSYRTKKIIKIPKIALTVE